MPVLIAAAILIFILEYTKVIKTKNIILDNMDYLSSLKEPDYDFLVLLRLGEDADPEQLFALRLRNGAIITIILFIMFLTNLNYINLVFALGAGYFAYKQQYWKWKGEYKRNISTYDQMLPYYLKSLEILIQHYTIPVALAKSVQYAPEVFRPGLREMIEMMNEGDSSIAPYMAFAEAYPVRESYRMMRLLYRLSLGEQENKEDRLITFSKSVSQLQNKSREMKYAQRLGRMEKRTMTMLACTGGGTMVILLISMFLMFTM